MINNYKSPRKFNILISLLFGTLSLLLAVITQMHLIFLLTGILFGSAMAQIFAYPLLNFYSGSFSDFIKMLRESIKIMKLQDKVIRSQEEIIKKLKKRKKK